MKNFLVILTAISSLLLLTGCPKDPTPPPAESEFGTLHLEFTANFNGQPFAINSIYSSAFNYQIKPETVIMLVHHIVAKASGGDSTEIRQHMKVDYSATSNEGDFSLMPGNYDGISFNIGVDGSLNHGDPSALPSTHAFSINQANDMFWSWSSGYIFFKFEGRADTTGTGSGSLDRLFFFHTGADTMYRRIEFYSSPFTITKGQTTNLFVELDVNKLLVGVSDTIDVKTDYATHTMDNLSLATRFVALYTKAFTVHQ